MGKKSYVLRSSETLLTALEEYKDKYFESGGFVITDEFEETDENLEERLSHLYYGSERDYDDSYKTIYDPNYSLQVFGVKDEKTFNDVKNEFFKDSNCFFSNNIITCFFIDKETTEESFHKMHLHNIGKTQLKVIKLNGEEICVCPEIYLKNKYTNELTFENGQKEIYVAISGILNVYSKSQKNLMTKENKSAFSDPFSGDVYIFQLNKDEITNYIKNVIETYLYCKKHNPGKNVLPPTIMGLMPNEVGESTESKKHLFKYGIEMRGKRYPDLSCLKYECKSENPTLQEIADVVPVKNYAKFSYCPYFSEKTVFLSLFSF